MRQLGENKSLWEPVELQPIMVEALQGQKMDFQSLGGEGTG
jgi:hypothetical protein